MAKILIVDDEADARVRLNSILADELGHEVYFAPDGEAAIDTQRGALTAAIEKARKRPGFRDRD